MKPSILYSEPHEVKGRLADFGCYIKALQDVALAAASARNGASPLHPVNAGGTYSYMEGVAALRMAFLPIKGWEMRREKGVESVENKKIGFVILFQNVDFACGTHEPNPISGKGEAVATMVDNPTGYLWPYMEEEEKAQENLHIWFFCVSSNGEEIRAELSRPRAIKNKGFGTFAERIFVIKDGDWSPIDKNTVDNNPNNSEDDFDIPVSKKK